MIFRSNTDCLIVSKEPGSHFDCPVFLLYLFIVLYVILITEKSQAAMFGFFYACILIVGFMGKKVGFMGFKNNR